MAKMIKANWQVSDGYAGKSRPQSTDIDLDEVVDSCDTYEEFDKFVEEAIQDDFDNTIRWSLDSDMDSLWKQFLEYKEKQGG